MQTDPMNCKFTEEQLEIVALILLKLKALRVFVSPIRAQSGPVVTTYYFKLSAEIPISKILNSEEDIAMAVGVSSVLITREGINIAIAIPNRERKLISFDQAIWNLMKNEAKSKELPIILGTDTKGDFATLDLTECPHILIAGSTGSGKSVLLSSIIAGLATAKTPQELRFLFVDTKQLDLTLFGSIPHLTEIADNLKDVHKMFDRVMSIIRNRTQKLKGIARNIKEYNALGMSLTMPYYVVVIDELADVINLDSEAYKQADRTDPEYYWLTKSERIPKRLQSLLQIARAVGVHVIVATQRPSVKVITGDIKANLGTRISLKLPTGFDSKTILDDFGAEKLLGKGDMLVKDSTSDELRRYHGPFVSMDDIAKLIINTEDIRKTFNYI